MPFYTSHNLYFSFFLKPNPYLGIILRRGCCGRKKTIDSNITLLKVLCMLAKYYMANLEKSSLRCLVVWWSAIQSHQIYHHYGEKSYYEWRFPGSEKRDLTSLLHLIDKLVAETLSKVLRISEIIDWRLKCWGQSEVVVA